MRRSGSQLRNLSNHAGRRGYGTHPAGSNNGAVQYADEIQRRIDALGLGNQQFAGMTQAPQMGMPNQAMNAQPVYDYPVGMASGHPNQYGHMPQMNPMAGPFSNVPQAQVHQPSPQMYGDFPSPTYPAPSFAGQQDFASANEMESIHSAIDALGGQLNAMQQHQMQAAQAMPQHSEINARQSAQLDVVTKEINELKHIIANVATDQSALQEIANLRQAMEATRAEFANVSSSSSVDPQAYANVVETSHSDLTRQIEELRSSLNASPTASIDTDIIHRTLEASHDELKSQIEHLQVSLNASLTNSGFDREQFESNHNQVLEQLSEIQTLVVDSVKSGQNENDNTSAFDSIEMRLEEITRAVVALSHSDPATDNLERLEARINELSKQLSDIPEGISSPAADTSPLVERLDEITQRLDEMANAIPAEGQANSLDPESVSTLQAVAHKVDALDAKIQTSQGFDELSALLADGELIQHLKQLSVSTDALSASAKLGQQSKAITRLEESVSQILATFETSSETTSSAELDELTRKLTSIEEQIASSRDISIEMATQVAQETVERVMEQLQTDSVNMASSAPDISVLKGLSEDISKLKEASSQTNTHNFGAFEVIKDSLGSMVERLNTLERGLSQLPVAASHATDTNSLPSAHSIMPQSAEASQVLQGLMANTEPAKEPDYEAMPGNPQGFEEAQTHEQHMFEEPEAETAATLPHQEPVYEAQPEIDNVPSIPSIEEFDQPVRLAEEELQDKVTGQDMVAEYRALVTSERGREEAQLENEVSIAQSLVDEAARAEEERMKMRASMAESNENLANESDPMDREFHSADMAIDTFADSPVIPPLPAVDSPELATPTPPMQPGNELLELAMDGSDQPLEPGSAGPDLAALVRKANETRKNRSKNGEGSSGTDFIAAARRAAQAAAEEASAAHEEVVKQEKEADKGVLSALPSLFSKRNKVISMAAAATLLAALSIPMITGALSTDEDAQLAERDRQSETLEAVDTARMIDTKAKSPRVIEAEDAPSPDEEIVVASLGNLQAEDPLDERSQQTFDTESLAAELTFVNDALKASVSNGDAQAMYEIGRRLLEGIGVEKSAEKAVEWYLRSAELGFAPAQYIVANLHEKAIGVERNIPEAMKWYEKAAGNGNVISMHNLAVLHATPNSGSGQPDTAAAYRWFKKAADYGVRDSLVNLGIFYTKGVGTDVNLVEAYKWFTLAAKAGDGDAEKKREVVTEYMRPDQLEVAKSKIEDWRPAERIVAANAYNPKPDWAAGVASAPIGENPESIRKAQALLGKLGYDAGPADGIMGAKTKRAIAEFQQRVGLGINGEISRELIAELEAVAI